MYFKFSAGRDVFDDGSAERVIADAASVFDITWTEIENLDRRMRRVELTRQRFEEHVGALTGAGLQQRARFVVFGANAVGAARLEVNATLHPYTGRYLTMFDLRVPRAAFESPALVEAAVAFFERTAAATEAIVANAHDTDDHAIQNIGSEQLLRRGYGIEVAGEVDLEANPGLEVSRGEFRYVVTWLTWLGAEIVSKLAHRRESALPIPEREAGSARWFRLCESPLSAGDAEVRALQAAVRASLGFRGLAGEEQRAFGFWQRKG